ncbi:TcaA NTF2-like domain-containing protein [Clostridium thermarum]|uniref:TcaA NTF2-like domain-containing protein n=1 Tax=Clostridium thermarum TaxID=1716543 RepID=UPI00111E3B20|nr:hypothetical protein [Clostridium thermarum]
MKKFVIAIFAIAVAVSVFIFKDFKKEPAKVSESPQVEQKDNTGDKDPAKETEDPQKSPENGEDEPAQVPVDETETPATDLPADKEDKDSSEGNSRPETFYVEELILNYSNLYPAVVSKDNIDSSVLDNVIMPDSEFSTYVSKQVADYKAKKATIEFVTFDIESIKDKDKDSFEVTVNQVIAVTIGGKTEEKQEKAAYIVKFTKERMGISQLIISN